MNRPCLLSASLTLACVPAAPEGACYLDAHCPAELACIEGLCAMPAESSSENSYDIPDDIKLDVGGATPEIPASCTTALAIRTSAGCEFWAVDLPNAWHASEPFSLDIAADQQFAVVVANVSESEVARVSVFSGDDDDAIEIAQVQPLTTHTFALPEQSIDPTANAVGLAFRVVSDVPITAYQFQPLDNLTPVYSNDASALLPAHVLENDYLAVTSDALSLQMYPPGVWEPELYDAGAFVTVIATVDDTHLELYPTAKLQGGGGLDVVLSRGQTYTILSTAYTNEEGLDLQGNLSGTRVIADRPIAVFSGNVTAVEPRGTEACCADHLEHQMLPLVAWGSSYIAVPPPLPGNPGGDAPASYRITAAFDGTSLHYAGEMPAGAPSTLDANETATFTTDAPLLVASDPAHPFAVTQFLLSGGENPGDSEDGDPGMIAQPALGQLQSRYVFLAPSGYQENVVVVYAPTGAEVAVDGDAITSWRELPEFEGGGWGFARVPIEPGAHVLIADRRTGIDVYGYDRNVSYAYAGGSAVQRISVAPPIP
ncbi:MAG: IgGFc-binding protein [Deltaproteobacteria bacterium]|nr:IgGFc-binding protein [Nannocystaceae bacterium]